MVVGDGVGGGGGCGGSGSSDGVVAAAPGAADAAAILRFAVGGDCAELLLLLPLPSPPPPIHLPGQVAAASDADIWWCLQVGAASAPVDESSLLMVRVALLLS